MTDSGDRPADEIEITPEMIEAGLLVLSKSGLVDDLMAADDLLVERIYREMHRVRYNGVPYCEVFP